MVIRSFRWTNRQNEFVIALRIVFAYGRAIKILNTIRYDTIGEFNVDWKAEY